MSAASQINNRSAEELIRMDMKEYQEQGTHFTVSQVETDNPEELITRKKEILAELESVKNTNIGKLFK